jgi:hypothetical protein
VKDLCGSLTYTADFGDLSSWVIYDGSNRGFNMNAPTNSGIDPTVNHSFYVSAELAMYPGQGQVTCAFQISVIHPCENPDSLTVQLHQNADSDYTSPAIFNFPNWSVVPSTCANYAVFSCAYMGGPYTGTALNECENAFNNNNFSTTITFDVTTGVLIFTTDDYETFPAGNYNF